MSEACTFPCRTAGSRMRRSVVLDLEQYRLRGRAPGHPLLGRPAILMLYLSERCQIFVRLDDQTHVMGLMVKSGTGGAYRDRTDDPLLAKQVLSQLS